MIPARVTSVDTVEHYVTRRYKIVVPAKAGTQAFLWIPAFAGMT
jgi:hypothetical protein